MKIKPAIKKYFIAGAVCFLTIAAITAWVIFAAGSKGRGAYADGGQIRDDAAGGMQTTADQAVQSGTDASAGTTGLGDSDSTTGMAGEYDPTGQDENYDVILNIYTTDRNLHKIIDAYAQKHWNFTYKLNVYNDEWVFGPNEVAELAGKALAGSNGREVDIYCLPAAYAPKFIKGEHSGFACTYRDLGIDVDAALKKADIPKCIVEDGSNPDGELIALPYLAETSVFVYRRSVAKEVWGTDDPDRIASVIGSGTEKWDKFIEAAQTLSEHGYYIVSGFGSLEQMIDTTAADIKGPAGSFEIDPGWLEFMDVSKSLLDNGCIKHTKSWWNEWWDDLEGKDKVFGFVTSTDTFQFMGIEETVGDWAVCIPPFNTRAPQNTGIMVSRNSPNKDLLGPLIEWITLDCSEDGLQYSVANATSDVALPHPSYKNDNMSVISGTVMKKVDGGRSILGGQNINQLVYDALKGSKGLYRTNYYANDIFQGWLNMMHTYIDGEKDREAVIEDFLTQVRTKGEVIMPGIDPSLWERVEWKDENFKEAVREQLHLSKYADIDKYSLINVTVLDLSGRNIKSLEDIAHFKNLGKLYCGDNQITDISCLRELKKLRKIDLSGNEISDISSLSDMKYLKELDLSNNNISDISGLKELPLLETLDLSENKISNIRSLAELQKLKDVNLALNRITNISSLKKLKKLRSLNMAGNKIADRSPVDHVDNVQWD
jgi:multiple sugar transport system substrate-binding protein